jgi:hypothetical protein
MNRDFETKKSCLSAELIRILGDLKNRISFDREGTVVAGFVLFFGEMGFPDILFNVSTSSMENPQRQGN